MGRASALGHSRSTDRWNLCPTLARPTPQIARGGHSCRALTPGEVRLRWPHQVPSQQTLISRRSSYEPTTWTKSRFSPGTRSHFVIYFSYFLISPWFVMFLLSCFSNARGVLKRMTRRLAAAHLECYARASTHEFGVVESSRQGHLVSFTLDSQH